MTHSQTDVSDLSKRERQIAEAYAGGASYKEIASQLGIAPTTVRTHLGTIYRKLGVSTKIELGQHLGSLRPTALQSVATDAPALPERPSVAVLPFKSLTSDRLSELMADGLTEDITSRLNYLRSLLVRARSAALSLAQGNLSSHAAAEQLDVRYLLEGSIRLAGSRLRVLASLVDAQKGITVWTQRFDREATELFDIQDEITQAIVVAMQVVLTDGEAVASHVGGTKNLDAWEAFQSAVRVVMGYTPESGTRARQLYSQALSHDPGYLDARVYRAWTDWQDCRSAFAADRARALGKCRAEIDALMADGVETANLLHLHAATLLLERRHEEAIEMSDRAAAMGPCQVFGHTPSGIVNIYVGRLDRAIELLTDTVRVTPYTPSDTVYNLALVFALKNDAKRSISYAEEYVRRVPTDLFAYTALALAHGLAGHDGAARSAIETLHSKFPFYRRESFVWHEPFRDQAVLDRVVDTLTRAGLTD